MFEKYKKRLLIISVFAFFVFVITGPAPVQAGRDGQGRHFLWSVETGKNTLYLVGSIHVLKKGSYPLPKQVVDIYNCCRKVVFETDLDGMNDPESQAGIMKLGMYPEGQTLSRNVSAQTYQMVEKKLAATGLPAARFGQFRPWFAAMTITSLEIMRLGFDPDLGIDRYFFKRALADRKELFFLETNEFQINLMAGLDSRQQEMFLRTTIKELDVIESMASNMVSSWMTGDVERLDSILRISYEEEPDIMARFLIDRNKKWVPLLEKLINQGGDVLVIVGAGHLVGKDSLIELLKRKGYRVRQL